LARRERILTIIETELGELKAAHTTPRRTIIEQSEDEIAEADLIANEKAVILLTEQGYIKRMPVNTFESQSRATRGKAGARIKEDDAVELFLTCRDHDSVLLFSDRGVVYCVRAYQIPMGSRTSRGNPIVQLLPIPHEEKITSIISVSEFSEDEYLVMLTTKGYIKKTALNAFSNIRTNGLIAISLEDGDQLRWVRRARVEDTIIVGSSFGKAIHFRATHEQLRPLGRATRGVRSMALREGDSLIGMDIFPADVVATLVQALESDNGEEETTCEETPETNETPASEASTPSGPWILVVTAGGYGKRVPVGQFRLQNRAGMGIVASKFRKANDRMAALRIVNSGDELMMITNRGIIIRQAVNAISCQSRAASGVRLQRLDEEDEIVAVALVPSSDVEETVEETDATSASTADELNTDEVTGDELTTDELTVSESTNTESTTTESTTTDESSNDSETGTSDTSEQP
jgi:DNA gyrase subunit A